MRIDGVYSSDPSGIMLEPVSDCNSRTRSRGNAKKIAAAAPAERAKSPMPITAPIRGVMTEAIMEAIRAATGVAALKNFKVPMVALIPR